MSELWSFFEMFHLIEAGNPMKRNIISQQEEEERHQQQLAQADKARASKPRKKADVKGTGKKPTTSDKIAMPTEFSDWKGFWNNQVRKQWRERMKLEEERQAKQKETGKEQPPIDYTPVDERSGEPMPDFFGGDEIVYGRSAIGTTPIEALANLYGHVRQNDSNNLQDAFNVYARLMGMKGDRMKGGHNPKDVFGNIFNWDEYVANNWQTNGAAWLEHMRRNDPKFKRWERRWEKRNLGGGNVSDAMDPMDAYNKWLDLSGYTGDPRRNEPGTEDLRQLLRNFMDWRGANEILAKGKVVPKGTVAHKFLEWLVGRIDQDPNQRDSTLDGLRWLADEDPKSKENLRYIYKAMDTLASIPWDDKAQKMSAAPLLRQGEDGKSFVIYPDATQLDPEEYAKLRAEMDPSTVGWSSEEAGERPSRRGSKDIVQAQGEKPRAHGGAEVHQGLDPQKDELRPTAHVDYTFTQDELAQQRSKAVNILQDADFIWKKHEGDPTVPEAQAKIQNLSRQLRDIEDYFRQAANFFRDKFKDGSYADSMAKLADGIGEKAQKYDDKWQDRGVKFPERSARSKQSAATRKQNQLAAQQAQQVQQPAPTTSAQMQRKTQQPDPRQEFAARIKAAREAQPAPQEESAQYTMALLNEVRQSFGKLTNRVAQLNKQPVEPERPKDEWQTRAEEWLKLM